MELISYAMDFVSFFMQNSKNLERINTIILFGSVARGEANKKSDIDLFFDVKNNEKIVEKEVEKIKKGFYNSTKFKNYWRLFGIDNEINIVIGILKDWKLKDSMPGSSLILYEPYSPRLKEGKNKTIIIWENIKNNSKRVMFSKKMFGFRHYELIYSGLLKKHNGVKIGANVILIDTKDLNIFLKEFRAYKIKARIIGIFEYSK